jgi:MarR family transcriptional regulator for hemolysin
MSATATKEDAPDIAAVQRDLTLKLTVIARQLRNRFDQSVAKLGITRSQWSLVAVVAHKPGMTQRTIAETLEISEAAAGRLIDRLCAERFLERRPRDDDRRAYSVHLNPEFSPRLALLGDIARQNELDAFAGMSEEQLEQLGSLLETVYRNIGAQRMIPSSQD